MQPIFEQIVNHFLVVAVEVSLRKLKVSVLVKFPKYYQ
jgi:hypothetical protein